MEPISEALARRVRNHRDLEAVWSRGEHLRLGFGELGERIEWRRRQLAGRVEHAVALATGNGLAFIELFFALRQLSLPVMVIDGNVPFADKITLCQRLGVGFLLHRALFGEDCQGDVLDAKSQLRLSRIAVDDRAKVAPETALIKLTSGSTGEPAGVCFREETLQVGIEQIGAGMEIGAQDRVLICIPLSHSYGFDNGILSLAALGTPLILERSFYPASLLRAIVEAEVTVAPLVPPLVRSLGQATWTACHRLRRVISAGGPLTAESAARFLESSGVPVHNFYGSTETGGISFEPQPLDPEAAGTVGRPLPGVEIKLDADRAVIVHSAANHLGYLGKDSTQCQRPVRTGDTAAWTPDGRLTLTGRSAEFLNIGGRKVAVARLEELMRASPGVEDAAVVGLEDEVRGDRVIAFVVAQAWPPVLETMPNGLKPRQLLQVQSLPYNARGKLDRHRLREMASEVFGG